MIKTILFLTLIASIWSPDSEKNFQDNSSLTFNAASVIDQDSLAVQKIKDITRQMNEEMDERALELMDESLEVLIVGNGSRQPEGQSGLEELFKNIRRDLKDLRLDIVKIFKIDDLYVVHFKVEGRPVFQKDSTKELIESEFLVFVNFKDGLVSRLEYYHNPLVFTRTPENGTVSEVSSPNDSDEIEVIEEEVLSHRSLIKQYYQAVNLDSETIRASFFSRNAEIRNLATGINAQGVDAIKKLWVKEKQLLPNKTEIVSQIDLAGDYAIVRSRVYGTYQGKEVVKGTYGKQIVYHPCTIFKLEDGRIASVDCFYNEMEMMIQLGTTIP